MKKVNITIKVSQEFYQVLEAVAKSHDVSVVEYVVSQVICGLDLDLQFPVATFLGFTESNDYQSQLRAMIAG